MNIVTESALGKQITATANVMGKPGAILGLFCSSGTATVAIYDSATTTTTTKVVDTFTPTVAAWTRLPFELANGCYVVVTGTGSFTVGVRES